MFAIDHLRKTFKAPGNVTVNAVDGISLGIETGKLITLLGPSGCGKTTTLRCLAGLERPEAGRIVIAGETVCDVEKGVFVPPSDRGIGMVFQSYAIWPHMSVFENVAFPLRVARTRKYSSAEIKDKVRVALELSDEIAVFNAGRIVQRGSPQDIYSHPTNRFVADFIGSANFLSGSVTREAGPDGMVSVATAHGILRCPFAEAVRAGQK